MAGKKPNYAFLLSLLLMQSLRQRQLVEFGARANLMRYESDPG